MIYNLAAAVQIINNIIKKTLSSGNVDEFRSYAIETARKLISLYPWYYLPSSVHKILIHGLDMIDSELLSIGELYEEAARG